MSQRVSPSLALFAGFATMGSMAASLYSRYPAFQQGFGLDTRQWGWLLFALGLGGLTSHPMNQLMLSHWTSRQMLVRCGVAAGALMATLPWLPGLGALLGIAWLLGMLINAINVAVQCQGLLLQTHSGRNRMGRLHSMFYVGMATAALISSLAVTVGADLKWHFGLLGALICLVYLIIAPYLLHDRTFTTLRTPDQPSPQAGRTRAVLALGAFGALATAVEGGVNGWVTLYLHEGLHLSASAAPIGAATFSSAMMVGRVLSDYTVHRWGPRRVIQLGTLAAGMALAAAVLSHAWIAVFAALVIAGLGQAAVFPVLFTQAGALGGSAVSSVASMGAGGGLVGPLLLARLAALSSMLTVMLTVAGGLLMLSWRADTVPAVWAPHASRLPEAKADKA
jgi:predicted MFS family arabinose efflux permease